MFGYAAYEVWADFRRRLLTRGTRDADPLGCLEAQRRGSESVSFCSVACPAAGTLKIAAGGLAEDRLPSLWAAGILVHLFDINRRFV
jgi:phosphohistidine phosphatase SixA